jgi:hypothetical protein
MNATTVLRNFLVLLGFLILTTACFEEDNFVGDNIERTGEMYPVVSNLTIVSGRDTFQVGETVGLDLRFWSEGTVAAVNAYDSLYISGADLDSVRADTGLVDIPNDTTFGVRRQQQFASPDPSSAAFSEVSQTDSLIIDYQVPTLPDTFFVNSFVVSGGTLSQVAVPSDTTRVDLDLEVVNDNGLSETNETANNFAISGFGILIEE